jgi:hypothetical protein
MLFFTCTWGVVLVVLYMLSSLLVLRCGCFVPLHMIFFTCTWVWLFCGSSDDLLLYFHVGVLFCGSSHDLLLYLYMGVMTIKSSILLRSNLTLIHSSL